MPQFTIVEAPSPLGVGPTGVEVMGTALLEGGLQQALSATHAGRVEPPPHDPVRDPESQILNVHGVRICASRLVNSVERPLRGGFFPVVLGGDCNILLGDLLALRRMGPTGYCFSMAMRTVVNPKRRQRGRSRTWTLRS